MLHRLIPLLFVACLLQSVVTQAAERPNVVLFLVDDMGWMDSGVYGSQYYETPHIDHFATQAMRFTNAYSQPLCSPTRASILSGQYTARHRITTASGHQPPQSPDHRFLADTAPANVPMLLPESKNYLDPSQITLAEALKNVGYRTAHIGKWHLGTTRPHWPEQQGFDVAFHCHPDPGPPGEYFSPYGVIATGEPTNKQRVGTITDGPEGEYIVDRQADEAVRFIRQSAGSPFFLNLWCYGVHGPWGHKAQYTEQFAKKQDPSGRQANPIMASMLRSVDECFGRILQELDQQGLRDNTIVIFYSDNGGNVHSNVPGTGKTEAAEKARSAFLQDWRRWAGDQPPTMNTPLRDGKGTLYEGGTRVPLMWCWPNRIAAGTVVSDVVGPIDVYPTVLELVKAPRPEQQIVDGVSYAEVLLRQAPLARRAYFNYHPHAGPNRAGGVWVRSGDFKLLRWFGRTDTFELYNLAQDLSETHDLSAEMPEKVRELNGLIDAFLASTGATYPRPNPAYQGEATTPKVSVQEAWKARGCETQVADGKLVVRALGPSDRVFLGHAAGAMQGPVDVTLDFAKSVKGAGRIEVYPQGASAEGATPESYPFTLTGESEETVTVSIGHVGRLGVLRLFLPATKTETIDIDRLELRPKTGKAELWTF